MTIRTLSDLLNDIKSQTSGSKVSLAQIIEGFHERGFGFFLFLFALPAALPIPAIGINAIIAIPLLLLTAQQAIGRHIIWVPQKLKNKSISKERLDKTIDGAQPWVKRLEFFVKPRLSYITQGIFSNIIGVAGFLMALAVSIPIPLTNTVPSFGIALMAIGVLMRDGLAVIAGMIIGTLWIMLLVGFILTFGPEGFEMMKDFIKGLLP